MRKNHGTKPQKSISLVATTFCLACVVTLGVSGGVEAGSLDEHKKEKLDTIEKKTKKIETDVGEIKKIVKKNSEKIESVEKRMKGALNYFGAGPAITINAWHKDRLNGPPTLDENGIVRLDKQSDSSVGIFLEAHYLWETEAILPSLFGGKPIVGCPNIHGKHDTICGFGPFVGVQPGGSDDIIEAIGAGIMWGFKGTGKNFFNSTQLNVGFGVFIDPTVETLGDGVFENQPLPVGETTIRTKEDYQTNFMVMFTVSPF